MVQYVITNEDVDKKDIIIKTLAQKIGVNPATSVVDQWFDNYDNFIFDNNTGAILAYKTRVHGEWAINDDILQDFRIK